MSNILKNLWFITAVRGILLIIFGLAALVFPNVAITVFIAFIGVFFVIDGILAVISAISAEKNKIQRFFWIEATTALIIGLFILFLPNFALRFIAYFIGAWAVVVGGLRIINAIRLRKVINTEWFYVISGILLLIFAGYVVAFPVTGLRIVVQIIGLFSIFIGTAFGIFALILKQREV